MRQKKNANCSTISQFVDITLDNGVQFNNCSLFDVDSNGQIIETTNLIRDVYLAQIDEYTVDTVLTDQQYRDVKYRPKRMSTILYSSIDYWYVLLAINRMSSCLDFNRRNIKVLTESGINFIKKIITKENERILENRKMVQKKLLEFR